MTTAATVLERCDALAELSEEPGLLVRPYGSAALRRATALVADWMREAGLEPREDAVGNLIGRRDTVPTHPALALGSHLDTVRDAGRYDGPLGVTVALAVAERVPDAPLEVIAFADEEGLRFGTAYLGSGAMAGRPLPLDARDAAGVRLGDVVPGDPAAAARDPAELRGYVEVHIEQGPVLERLDAPVGVVTAIAGQTHAEIVVTGEAGHAGTVPMDARRDALAAAAQLVLAVEEAGGTVGRLGVEPGARNVIPARATLTLDLRHADDAARHAAVAALRDRARAIAAARGVELDWRAVTDLPAVAMDERLSAAFGPLHRLPSGAGHDAAAMASITPAAMLFVRCRGGISHHPAESVEHDDVAAAIDALERLVRAV